jgi:hypothetical protein
MIQHSSSLDREFIIAKPSNAGRLDNAPRTRAQVARF